MDWLNPNEKDEMTDYGAIQEDAAFAVEKLKKAPKKLRRGEHNPAGRHQEIHFEPRRCRVGIIARSEEEDWIAEGG
eukprot:9097814-Pyramimonas_sp.AAC.1